MTIDPRRDARREASGASVRPDAEAAATALAAAVLGQAFRTRVKLKSEAGPGRELHSEPEPLRPRREPDRVEAIAPKDEAVADLTRIRGLTPDQAQRLREAGTTAFAQIAAWRRDDVTAARRLLGLKREISKQNWIEQAALLAVPGTQPAPRRAGWPVNTGEAGPLGPRTPEPAAVPQVPVVLSSKPLRPSPSAVDRLDLIRGMNPAAEALLRAGGVHRVADIACWTAADVSFWSQRLGAGRGLTREGWIEQAEMLRQGRATAYASVADHLPEIELITPQPPAGFAPSPEPSLLTRLKAARLGLTSESPAKSVTVFDVIPPPSASPDRTPETAPAADLPAATAAATPRRLLPRYVEFVRHSFFELPPLPLSPLMGDVPATDAASAENQAPLVPVAEPPETARESDQTHHLADIEPSSEARLQRRPALPPSPPARARRQRPSNLVPRRPRIEAPREGVEPAKRLTERLAELDQTSEPRPAGVAPPASLVRKRPLGATDPDPFTTADHGGPDALDEAEVVIKPQSAVPALAPSRPILGQASKAEPSRLGMRDEDARADPADHAAYREAVEEASVEIVRRTPSGPER